MNIRERHFDYGVLVGTVPIGGIQDLSLRMDSDAPFMLRMVKSRNLGLSGWRIQTASREWQSSDYRTDLMVPQFFGDVALPSRGSVLQPGLIYPPGSQLVFSVANNTDAALTNVRMLFRGSKLYQEGSIARTTYPARMSTLPFQFPQTINNLGVVESRLDQPFNVDPDSDFALNWAVCDPFNPAAASPAQRYEEVYAVLRDESRLPYSNGPIHINDLFGQGIPTSFPAFSTPTTDSVNDPPVLNYPNRFSPSIYVPRNGALYLDVHRNETASGLAAVNLYIRYGGVKVYDREGR